LEIPVPRIQPIDPTAATGVTATHLDTCRKMFGGTPNLFTTAAHSPAALGALLALFANVGKSSLGAKTGELIAVAIAQSNGCRYCLAAHTAIGTSLGVSAVALSEARQARAADARTAALLDLAVAINQSRGRIADQSLAAARAAGISDAEIIEVVAHIALNVFTNYMNNVAGTTVDFPEVPFAAAA
jgi:uncharacterized peroxidase-related enzyme